MRSVTTERFRKAYQHLPIGIKLKAKVAFSMWKESPRHPGLRFRKIHDQKEVFSVRIGISWRALGVKKGNTMIWFWIGSHEDYNNLIGNL